MAKKKVLVIDDNAEFCEITKSYLESTMKYRVFTARSGPKGIMLAKQYMPDVILLDIRMPDMDGGMVAELLLDDSSTSHIPIIFLTGLIMPEEVKKSGGFIAGHPFIAKPFKLEELTGMIESVTIGPRST